MSALRTSADNPRSVNDHILGLFRPLLNVDGCRRLCAILDWHANATATPTSILAVLDQCDRLLHSAQPLPKDFTKARAALRRACVEVKCRELRAARAGAA